MAKRTGISLVSTDGGLLRWKLGDASEVELNTNKCDFSVQRAAMFAGFHRAISNIGGGKDKANWAAIRSEMQRRIRGMLAGQWKVPTGGYGFADHVEAIVRLALTEGKSVSHETISEQLLGLAAEKRTEHAARPKVRAMIAAIVAERMAKAADESDEDDDSILSGLE